MEQVTKQEFKELAKSVKRIEAALLGDKGMNMVGMAQKVENHEQHIKKFAWYNGASAGAGFSLSMFIAYIKHKYF